MLDNSEAVIKECIALLQQSGKNTKAIVLEKLRGKGNERTTSEKIFRNNA